MYVLVVEIQVDYNYDYNFLDDGTETQPEEQICLPEYSSVPVISRCHRRELSRSA